MIVVKTQLDEMPRNCYECPFALSEYRRFFSFRYVFNAKSGRFGCVITDKAVTSTKRNRFCPLAKMDEVIE